MKKTITVISSLVVVVGVFTSQSFAHGGNQGFRGHHGHGAKHAQIYFAKLTPPGATGATGAVASRYSHHGYGSTGETGATGGTTGPVGKVLYAQNKKRYAYGVRLYKLGASTEYHVTIVKNEGATATTSHYGHWGPTDATGPTSTSTTPPPIDAITTDANGYGKGKGTGLRSAYGLDPAASYFVTVTNPAGDVVLQGDLTTKRHKSHKGGCNLQQETGTATRHSHHH
jgi:hypothetical protein